MNDEASVLRTAWMSQATTSEISLRAAAAQILDRDEADRVREQRMRIVGLGAMVILVPTLIWAAAHGIGPLVRAGYALMAIGCVALVVAEWLYLAWSRRALPGPNDARSQLQTTAYMVESRAWLARTAGLWSAPVLVGAVFISVWLYRERTLAAAVTVLSLSLAAWVAGAVLAARAAAGLGRRRRELEAILADLRDDAPPR